MLTDSHERKNWLSDRRRRVMKKTAFTPQEWTEVVKRIHALRAWEHGLTWQEYSHRLATDGEIRVLTVPYDPRDYLWLLTSIAKNVNELARLANSQGGVDENIVQRAYYLVAECVGVTQSCIQEWDESYENSRKNPKTL